MDSSQRFLDVLNGQPSWPPPVWLMRQAGRYLPEYRKVRADAGSFMDLCFRPDLAAEVTLQPVRRYGMDAAIIFADILLIADALGQKLRFEDGIGPILEPKIAADNLSSLSLQGAEDRLKPVYETVSRVREGLGNETTVIGFCGAPWTVATYMASGRPPGEHLDGRLWAYQDPKSFGDLIDLLIELSATYLIGQIDAGAGAVKIFDSWSGVLSEDQFEKWVIAPTKKLVDQVKSARPGVPVLGFPRGCGALYEDYIAKTGVDAVAIDTMVPLDFARQLQKNCPVQGNIDPVALMVGGSVLDDAVDKVLDGLGKGPLIVNLGHGVNKETDPENVARLVERVRAAKSPW